MRRRELVCWSAVVVAAVAWWAVPWQPGMPPAWQAVRALPAALLAGILGSASPGVPARRLLALALLIYGCGDLVIERWFLPGTGLFLLGHLLVIAVIWRRHRSAEQMEGADHLRLGGLAVAGALLVAGLAPRLGGDYRWAVPAYAGALLAMAGSSQLSRRGRPWVPMGGALFVLSDAILALERFGAVRSGARWVWPLYVAALVTIAGGWRYGREEAADDSGDGEPSVDLDGLSRGE